MKVLFYLNRFPAVGGIERITSTLADMFADKLGYHVGIFSFEKGSDVNAIVPSKTDFIHVCSDNVEDISHQLSKCIESYIPDVVIFQDSYATIEDYIISLKAKYGFKLLTVEHNTPDCHIKEYLLRWKAHSCFTPKGVVKKLAFPVLYLSIVSRIGRRHRRLIDNSDSYILLSNSYKRILHRYWRIVDSKITAIPNIKNDFGCSQPIIDLSKKKKQALFVGRLTQQKGVKYLIDIWSRIEDKLPDWNLVVLGDGELRKYMEKEIAFRGLRRVEIKGFVTNVDDYYRESKALLMTSIFEGFGLVLVEAMQFGTVPFAFDSFSAVHDIIDGQNGYIITPFDVEQYSRAFINFATSNHNTQVNIPASLSESNILSRWKELIEK